MSDDKNSNSIDVEDLRLKSLSDQSTKAELYIVSLTFSILALSIQFPVESDDLLVLRLQAAGWLFLVVCGIAGIQLLRSVSVQFGLELAKYVYTSKSEGSPSAVKAVYKIQADASSHWISEVEKVNVRWWHPIQGYFLISGISFLALARIAAVPLF
jgi:hypothetical protein